MKEKVKNFIKNHKKEIALVTGTAVVTGMAVIKLCSKEKLNIDDGRDKIMYILAKALKEGADLDTFDVGDVVMVDSDGEILTVMLEDVSVGDTGELGEMCEQFNGIVKDSKIGVILGLPMNEDVKVRCYR